MTPHIHESSNQRSRTSWLGVLLAIGLAAAAIGLLPSAEAKVGGYSEVTRLELRYTPGEDVLEARFHLASGIALDQRIEDGPDVDRLLKMATALAQDDTKMFVTAHEDQVRSWHLTVP